MFLPPAPLEFKKNSKKIQNLKSFLDVAAPFILILRKSLKDSDFRVEKIPTRRVSTIGDAIRQEQK
jgi:hypothetical protein